MKKMLLVLSVVGLFLVSCSTVPVSTSARFPAEGSKYVILGRVSLETPSNKSGYLKLLEAAKAQYPDCDDVVNVVVDGKIIPGLFRSRYKYIMSGVAIDYVEVK